jgi:hypothetical protein
MSKRAGSIEPFVHQSKSLANPQVMACRALMGLGLLLAVPAHGEETLCHSDEKIIFNCRVAASPKIISICGSPNLDAAEGYLQYRFGTPKRIDFVFPATTSNTQQQFSWEWHHPYQSFSIDLWFQNNGYVYDVFSEELSEALNGVPGGTHKYGVRVYKEDSEKPVGVGVFDCETQPTGEFDLGDIVPNGS